MVGVVLECPRRSALAWLVAEEENVLGLVTMVGAREQQGSCFLSAGTVLSNGLDELSGVQCRGRRLEVMHCLICTNEPNMHTVRDCAGAV